MLSNREIIENDKADLRREYTDDAAGLALLKALAKTFFDNNPSNVELTQSSFEGGSGGGQLTHSRELRRAAIRELIAERDAAYVLPPQRASGFVMKFGGYGATAC